MSGSRFTRLWISNNFLHLKDINRFQSWFSHWNKASLCRQATVSPAAKAFLENIIPNCRNPLKLHSDQGTHFAVQVLQQAKFVKVLQITLAKSIALVPLLWELINFYSLRQLQDAQCISFCFFSDKRRDNPILQRPNRFLLKKEPCFNRAIFSQCTFGR